MHVRVKQHEITFKAPKILTLQHHKLGGIIYSGTARVTMKVGIEFDKVKFTDSERSVRRPSGHFPESLEKPYPSYSIANLMTLELGDLLGGEFGSGNQAYRTMTVENLALSRRVNRRGSVANV